MADWSITAAKQEALAESRRLRDEAALANPPSPVVESEGVHVVVRLGCPRCGHGVHQVPRPRDRDGHAARVRRIRLCCCSCHHEVELSVHLTDYSLVTRGVTRPRTHQHNGVAAGTR